MLDDHIKTFRFRFLVTSKNAWEEVREAECAKKRRLVKSVNSQALNKSKMAESILWANGRSVKFIILIHVWMYRSYLRNLTRKRRQDVWLFVGTLDHEHEVAYPHKVSFNFFFRKNFFFWGGKMRCLGGSFPLRPPVDRTLTATCKNNNNSKRRAARCVKIEINIKW